MDNSFSGLVSFIKQTNKKKKRTKKPQTNTKPEAVLAVCRGLLVLETNNALKFLTCRCAAVA